jgi:hypothetical protein
MNRYERLRLEGNYRILRDAWGITAWYTICFNKATQSYMAENVAFDASTGRAPMLHAEFSKDGMVMRNVDTFTEETLDQKLYLLKSQKR